MPDNREDPQAVIIWDLRTGQKKRGFHCENASTWPIFKQVIIYINLFEKEAPLIKLNELL